MAESGDGQLSAIRDRKTEIIASIIKERHNHVKRILAVGCGSGIEAAVLAQELNAEVIGIDLQDDFSAGASDVATLHVGDATALSFGDESFDFVYSFHALEHIHDPEMAIGEIHRVLSRKGVYWIGAPNRSRMLGYVGSRNFSFGKKIQWNLRDWVARLKGEFRNELGAHAGFSTGELQALLETKFGNPHDVALSYYCRLYPQYKTTIEWVARMKLERFIFPSVYFIGTKE